MGHLKRICKDAFSVTRAVQETCSSELLGCILGASDLQFWEDDLTGAALRNDLASLFRGRRLYFRQVEWKNRKTHWYEAVSSALNFPFLKEVSQNCFVFHVVNFEH